jgi:hypothetical protein
LKEGFLAIVSENFLQWRIVGQPGHSAGNEKYAKKSFVDTMRKTPFIYNLELKWMARDLDE